MATQVQFRRGTTSETAAFTGAVGEVTVDTNKRTVVVHDGATVGGFPLLKENGDNSALASGSISSPALKFANSTNTGIYSPLAGTFSLVANGIASLTSDTSGNLTAVGTITAAGRSTSPSFAISATSSIAAGFNGLYSATSNNVSIATDGAARLTVNATGDVTITGGLSLGSTFSSSSFGLSGAPSVTPPAGLNGMYLYATNTIGFATNGTLAFRVDSSGTVTFSGGLSVSSSFSAPNLVPTSATVPAGISLYAAGTTGIGLSTGGLARLTVNASGNVSIVSGTLTTSNSNTATVFIPTSATVPAGISVYAAGTTGIGLATGGLARLTVDASGNVSIASGTLTTSNTNTATAFVPSSATVPAGIGVYAAGTTGIGLATGGLARLTIDASGNVSVVSGTLTTSNSNTATTFIPTSATAPVGIGVYAASTTGIGLATGGAGRLTIDSTGTSTFTGSVTGTLFVPNSSTAPTGVGVYAPGGTGIGLATGGAGRLTIDSTGSSTFTGSVTATVFAPTSSTPPVTTSSIYGTTATGIGLATAGTARLTIDASGNTTVVSGTLTTSSGSNTATTFIPTSATAPSIGLYAAGTTGVGLATGSTGRLTITAAGASSFTGSVGATTFTPSSATAPSIGLYAAGTTGVGLSTGSAGRLTIDASGNTTVVSGTLTTSSGSNTAYSFIPTNATVPTNGLYLPAANAIAFSTGSTERLRIDSSGNTTVVSGTLTTSSGSNTAYSFIPTNATVPTNGLYLPAANAIGFSTGSTERLRIDSSGNMVLNGGVVIGELYYKLNNTVAGANVTTAQSIFGVGVTVTADTVYILTSTFVLTKSVGGTTHNISVQFGGTSSMYTGSTLVTGMGAFVGSALAGNTNTNSGSQNIVCPIGDTPTSPMTVTANISSAITTVVIQLSATIAFNTGGTFIPQYILSAAPGGAYTTAKGSFIRLVPVGSSTAVSNLSYGTWA